MNFKKSFLALMVFLFCVICVDLSFAATSDPEKDEFEKIKKTLDFKVDEVEGITWINDKNTAKNESWAPKIFHIYLGQKRLLGQETTWIRWKFGFIKPDWVFFDVVIFNIDGERAEIIPGQTLRKVLRGSVLELADINGSEHLALLKKIADSKKTIIRFSGRDYRYDFVVSNEQKSALKRLLRYYELVSK